MASFAVDTVQTAFEAFARGDLDAVAELCDPDIVVRDPERTGTTFQGPDALRRFFEEWLENWEEYRSEPQEFIESGDQVMVRATQTGRGKRSGIEIRQDISQVFRVRDGRIVEYRVFTDRDEALGSMSVAE
jgi:uncharacterized protein